MAVDAWLAITENNTGPQAYRPQEVVRAANGTTIQVIHSDAEGRMVLADTLALAARTRPRLIIDFGTLTGACVHALTERYSGVFTNRPALAAALAAAGARAASASGSFRWTRTSTAIWTARSPTSCNARSTARATTSWRRASCDASCDGRPWVHVDLSSATRRGGLAHVGTEITGFGVRFTLELLLGGGCMRSCREHPADHHADCAAPTTGTCICATARRCAAVLPFTAARFARAIVMPNLKPPVTTTALALAYRERIRAALPAGRVSSR